MLGIIDKMGVLWYHNKCIKHCADWVEREIQSTKRIIVDWTGIIFASDQRVSSTTVCLKPKVFTIRGYPTFLRDTGRLTTNYIENTIFDQNIVAYAYRTTTMQLMIRGFGFTDASEW